MTQKRKGLLIEDDVNGMKRAIGAALSQELIPTYKVYVDNTIEWDWVKSYDEFVKYILENGIPDVFAFDHDLGIDNYEIWHKNKGYVNSDIDYEEYITKTGFHCANWLVNYCLDNNITFVAEVYSHSMNNKGRENILSILNNFKKSQNFKNGAQH